MILQPYPNFSLSLLNIHLHICIYAQAEVEAKGEGGAKKVIRWIDIHKYINPYIITYIQDGDVRRGCANQDSCRGPMYVGLCICMLMYACMFMYQYVRMRVYIIVCVYVDVSTTTGWVNRLLLLVRSVGRNLRGMNQ